MGELRAGVIGAGSMGCNHLRVLGELPGVTPILAVDPALDGGLAVPILPDLTDIGGRIDLAVLAAPSALHEPLGIALAGLGVPTLIEKPVATTARAARRLVRAYAESGVAAAAGHVERFNPVVRALREALAGEPVGEINELRTIRVGPFPGREMPVGVVGDLLVHDIDLAGFVLGAEYESVRAVTHTDPGRPCEDEVRVEAILGEADGRMFLVEHHASRVSATRERRIEVVGELGCLVADLFSQTLTLERWDGTSEQLPVVTSQPLAGELAAWCEVVRSGRPDPVLATLADGLRAVQVAEAVLSSASAGEPVRLKGAA